jgi:hypothetical protein
LVGFPGFLFIYFVWISNLAQNWFGNPKKIQLISEIQTKSREIQTKKNRNFRLDFPFV